MTFIAEIPLGFFSLSAIIEMTLLTNAKKNNYHPNNGNFVKGGLDVHPLSFYSSLLLSSMENEFCYFLITRIYFAHFILLFHLFDWSMCLEILKEYQNLI